jgi:hypothetical protein
MECFHGMGITDKELLNLSASNAQPWRIKAEKADEYSLRTTPSPERERESAGIGIH